MAVRLGNCCQNMEDVTAAETLLHIRRVVNRVFVQEYRQVMRRHRDLTVFELLEDPDNASSAASHKEKNTNSSEFALKSSLPLCWTWERSEATGASKRQLCRRRAADGSEVLLAREDLREGGMLANC